MMRGLIALANNAEDERVRSVCLVAVLDRAGVRPIDKPEPDQKPRRPRLDPSKYTLEELECIGEALRAFGRPSVTAERPDQLAVHLR
jgi:hypothetical protein